jgi:hypothetical protein
MIKISCHEDIINYCQENNIGVETFNEPVEIVIKNTTNLSELFSNCKLFNQPVIIPEGTTNTSFMFVGCISFNQPVTIPDTVQYTNNMFDTCIKFNQPIILPAELKEAIEMFLDCYTFNSPVSFEKIKSYQHRKMLTLDSMFENCHKFNQPVNIPYANSCEGMFQNCYNFNSKINFVEYDKWYDIYTKEEDPLTLTRFLFNCYSFNQKIEFPNQFTRYVTKAFENCYSFNQEVVFDGWTKHLEHAFRNCTEFNSNITLPKNKRDICVNGLLEGCISFNSSIITDIIPYSIEGMFKNCKNLTHLSLDIKGILDNYNIKEIFKNCDKLRFDEPLNIFDNIKDIKHRYEYYEDAFAGTNIDLKSKIENFKNVTTLMKFFAFVSKYDFDRFKERVKVKINDTNITVSLKSFLSTRFTHKNDYTYMYNDYTETITVLYDNEYTRRNPISDHAIAKMLLDSTLEK